jgi:hypothetical protein
MPKLRWIGHLVVLAGLVLPWPVGAAAAPPSRPESAQAASPRTIDCRCRANGRTYELGQRVCLSTPSGHRVAECRMVQNVTSWAVAQEDCSVSALLRLPEASAVFRPAAP